jgi:hypothetical protein
MPGSPAKSLIALPVVGELEHDVGWEHDRSGTGARLRVTVNGPVDSHEL